MERSCLVEGERCCRVFYCDAMRSDQKAEAEKNHEELRRILPKGRSDFDRLTQVDVAAVCSRVNSYPRPAREGKCPFDLAAPELPGELLGNLGVDRVPPDEVLLRPALVAHAVEL